ANVAITVAVPPGAIVAPLTLSVERENWPPPGPVSVTPPAGIMRFAVPAFVTVKVCAGPLVPTGWLPNALLVGSVLMLGAIPAPVRALSAGEPAAFEAMLKLALFSPTEVGANATITVAVLLGAIVAPLTASDEITN